MSSYKITNRDINAFSVIELEKYLRFHEFKKITEKKNTYEYIKYFPVFDETVIIPVPKSKEIINYYESIFNILSIITSIYNLNVQEVITNIVQVSNDTLKMRIINLHKFSRSIPLDIATNEINALKKLFIFGASSEEKPRPFFDKATTNGLNHANHCQFGHTFEGSFGFTINSPIIEDFTQLTFEKEPIRIPFERKVIERITNGFIHTKEALLENSTDPITNNFEIGFNSRMCDSIVEMSNQNTNMLQFDLLWSPQIDVREKFLNLKSILFKHEAIEIIKNASTKLKTIEPFDDSIIGKIITLHSNKSPFSDEDFPRTAIVKHFYENHPIEVKLELSMKQYKEAYMAHGKGLKIKAIGKTYRKGNTWRMVDVKSIESFHS